MNRRTCIALSAILCGCIIPLAAARKPVSGDAVMKHVRVLADDAMEGRGTASAGERRAALYVAEQFRLAGLKPGAGGQYLQEVPLVGVTADPSLVLDFSGATGRMSAAFFEECVVGSGVAAERVAVDAEVLFVGYGIAAPGQSWDDFKGADVRGKVLLALVNDPPAEDPAFFGGRAMTYYGRWTYKYEEAARRGAAGVLLVHTDESAGYPWQVVQKSWAGEQFQIDGEPSPLQLRGWLRRDVAARLLKLAGRDLDEAVRAAGKRDFAPLPLGLRVKTEIRNGVRRVSAPNVVGILTGTERPGRHILLSAHHDHFGIGRPDAKGDCIYNGALDNATGVALVIELARVLASARPPDSIVFLTVTGEEQGLIGSAYYALHPAAPLEQTTAALNLDGINVFGRTRDVTAPGAEMSGLGALVAAVASEMRLEVKPDPHPERGGFFRSDHFSLVRAGVPAVSLNGGNDYVDKPSGWGEKMDLEYLAKHYHQPSDEIRPEWETGGFVQAGEFTLRLIDRLGRESGLVAWKPDSPYRRK